MKKIIMVLLFCAALCATCTQNEGDFIIDQEGAITFYKGVAKEVDIPDRVGKVQVTAIGDYAFQHKDLTSVTIPKGVKSIGKSAFDWNKITSISIPGSVTSIGEGAFSFNRLSSVVIPRGVTSINDNTFAYNQLASITIPNGVTFIGNGAFANNQINSVTIPDTVTYISAEAFRGNKLESVSIPDTVTFIGDNAFRANQLSSITIPTGITSIGEGVFRFNQLSSVTIPAHIRSIGKEAFAANQLTSVTMLAYIDFIPLNAFESNPLTTLIVGGGVTLGSGPWTRQRVETLVLGDDVRFSSTIFGSLVYDEYQDNGRKAGTYSITYPDNSESDWYEYSYKEYPATRTLTGKTIYLNDHEPEDERPYFGTAEETNYYDQGLIGWTNNGLVAYLKYDFGYMWISGIRLIIYDAAKNIITENILKDISHNSYNYEPILPPDEEIRATLKTWNDALTKHNFSARINKFYIHFDCVKPSLFPYVQDGTSWDCWFEADVEGTMDDDDWGMPILVKWNLMGSNGSQTKTVASGVEESRGGRGMGGKYAGSQIIGYYESHFEDRLLVVIAHYSAGFEGKTGTKIQLYGFHLSF